ncbi:SHC-transforming protein 2 [Tyrophagus putrescentiae]|nr:SHC-transforming protein 2 [Tyrophagus putrescentiae]
MELFGGKKSSSSNSHGMTGSLPSVHLESLVTGSRPPENVFIASAGRRLRVALPPYFSSLLLSLSGLLCSPLRLLGAVPLALCPSQLCPAQQTALVQEAVSRVREAVVRSKCRRQPVLSAQPDHRLEAIFTGAVSLLDSGLSLAASLSDRHLTLSLLHSGQSSGQQSQYGVDASGHSHYALIVSSREDASSLNCLVLQGRRALCLAMGAQAAFHRRVLRGWHRERSDRGPHLPLPSPPAPLPLQYDLEEYVIVDDFLPTEQSTLQKPNDLRWQPWYHDSICRSTAHQLITEDGQFLVRASLTHPDHFILSGMLYGDHVHLQLRDIVHKKIPDLGDTFAPSSVTKFIQYHIERKEGVLFGANGGRLLLLTPINLPKLLN